MVEDTYVVIVLVVLGAIAAASFVAYLGHALGRDLRERRTRTRRAQARAELMEVAGGRLPPPSGRAALCKLPLRTQIDILVEVMPLVMGDARAAIAEIAAGCGVEAHARRRCKSPWKWRRVHGIRLYALLGTGHGVVPDMLQDRAVEVRGAALAWAAGYMSPDLGERLVSLLAEPGELSPWLVRDAVVRAGGVVGPALEGFLATASGPGRRAGLEVAARFGHPAFAPASLNASTSPEPADRVAALDALGGIGGDAAVTRIAELLDDPDASVRAAAVRAVGRSSYWPAAPVLAGLLRDPAWDVRLAAGRTLRDLGAPGLLLLRRSLKDGDPYASEMAQLILDLPDPSQLA